MTSFALFGATGKVGRLLVDAALVRGFDVRALVRPAAHFDPRPGVEVVRGSVEDAHDVAATVSDATAVCCVFGPRTTSDAPFCARATANVVAAMKASGARRLVCLTGAMVGGLPPNVSGPMQLLARLYRRQVPVLAADAAEQERIVMASGLEWTLVKPPRLADGPAAGKVRSGPALRVGLLSSLRRGDLAVFLVDELTLARHVHQRVYVRH